MRLTALCLVLSCAAAAEVHTLTWRQTLDRALKQNPDILMARLDEQRAAAAVREAKDPFTPKLFVGSGLAKTSGFPMSIEGSAPSVFQTRAVQSLYNRPLSLQVAATRENARGAVIETDARREEIVHRILLMHLSAARAARVLELVRQQVASFEAIAASVRARVDEGRELPIEARAAELRITQSRHRLLSLEAEREQTESSLAIALGFGADDRVRAAEEEPAGLPTPDTEAAAVESALTNSKQLRRLESTLQAKQLQAQSARAARYPQVDLVAQYAVMAKFNNYEDFFQRFQRHNWQFGVSFQLPVFPGGGSSARESQAELEMARVRIEINNTRSRIAVDTKNAWRQISTAQGAREVARLDLDVTRERLSVILAQFEAGRASLRQVEELRSAESDKWLAFYDAQHLVEQARFELLRHAGTLLALAK